MSVVKVYFTFGVAFSQTIDFVVRFSKNMQVLTLHYQVVSY